MHGIYLRLQSAQHKKMVSASLVAVLLRSFVRALPFAFVAGCLHLTRKTAELLVL